MFYLSFWSLGWSRGDCVNLTHGTLVMCHFASAPRLTGGEPCLLERPMRLFFLGNLHITLVLTIVLPLLLISGLGVYWGLGVIQTHDETRMQEDLALVAHATRYPLSRAIEAGDYVQVNDITTSIFSIGQVYGASVYDRRGDRVSQVGVVDVNIRESQGAADAVARGDELGVFREIEGETVFSHFTPLFSADGRIIGLLQITRQRSDFDQRLESFRANAWWVWSITAGAILLVAIAGHYGGIGRHVDRLLEAMEQVRKGGRQVRVPKGGPREIQHIATALNDMLLSVEQAEDEILTRQRREAQLNQRLQHQEKMAMIGRVAGGVAHELGAPLSVVEGRARILQRQGPGDSGSRHIEDIRVQVQRMTRIIRQLLDCFRHGPQAMSEVLGATDLVNHCLDNSREELASSDVQLTVDNQAADAQLRGDATRLELALSNLLRNAAHAAHSQVLVTLQAGSQAVAITVEDDGPGIPLGDREQVLEPFYTTKAAGEGTGLGLAVVKSVMQEHQGQLLIGESRWGGCAVVLQWPLVTPESSTDNHPQGEHS
ncbi:MAG: sensor histidine kinase [Halomonadaceae bacterium]|nr:MAG: sensor histidine kinase [Halomonadaceae bacterium]